MALTALKIYDNTNTNEMVRKTVIGKISTGGTYTIPEAAGFGTAIVLSCSAQDTGTAIVATVSSRTVTFTAATLKANSVVCLQYTFQK